MAAIACPPRGEEDIEDASEVVKSKPLAVRIEQERARRAERGSEDEGDEKTELRTNVNGEVPGTLESVNLNELRSNSDSEGSGSQTVLIREKSGRGMTEDSRLESLRLSSRTDFTQTDTFKVRGKTCTVTLEEDCITWAPQKSSGKECLYLSDVFAVVPGPTKPLPHTRGQRRLSTSVGTSCEFTLHALRSIPNSPGVLTKLTFKSTRGTSTNDACEVWTQQIQHQLQNFGNRPRKLYVVVNPASGEGSAVKTWDKVERLFQLTHITTELMYTQRPLYARDVLQNLDLSQYDGVVVVGGDGTVNEVLNALALQTQQQSGVNIRRARFVPVSVNLRLGIVPAGLTNSIAWSVLGCRDPSIAAAQIMLGCNTAMDVSSLSHNGQLVMFCAGTLAYGFWADMNLYSQDFSWLGSHRYEAAMIRTLFSHRSFEAEVTYVPVEDTSSLLEAKERCFSRCSKCANFDSHLESPSSASHKGASVLATYSEEDTVDQKHWKKITGRFSNIMVCPHACLTHHAPLGFSPYAHVGNGCADIVLLSQCSKIGHARWLMRQKKSRDVFELPYVQILRVKEFKFREVLGRRTFTEENEMERSMDNLVQDDDDEATNRRAGFWRGRQGRSERDRDRDNGAERRDEIGSPASRWNVDGNEIGHSDIEFRVHRHLITMLARGVEPAAAQQQQQLLSSDMMYSHNQDTHTHEHEGMLS